MSVEIKMQELVVLMEVMVMTRVRVKMVLGIKRKAIPHPTAQQQMKKIKNGFANAAKIGCRTRLPNVLSAMLRKGKALLKLAKRHCRRGVVTIVAFGCFPARSAAVFVTLALHLYANEKLNVRQPIRIRGSGDQQGASR